LWDVRVLRRLEQWQEQYGDAAPGWFEALGELEALLSLAALRDENPDWVFPEWADNESTVLSATRIGHPLLTDGARVCNDVCIGPTGSVLLVTGSNMSGKSTMLRSVGLNVSLAGSGAPVCAARLVLPSLELATSIRVRDNLAEGVSFYMAELQRLKGAVQHAASLAENPDRKCLYLLDEILQGTNSRERLIAVARVLERLLELGAIGAISTHDLELASEPSLAAVSEVVHFRETIESDGDGGEKMTFDYRMREGVSPTTNALRLLEIVGICEDSDGKA
ncbi:MAG: MutS family DNA mismatch repair protein, partial [Planctomycetota bacterium]